MLRACLIILILQFGLIFHGCAPLKHLDGSSEEERKKFKMTKDEMWNEMKRMKIENGNLQREIHILREENQRIRDENQILATRLTQLQLKYETLSSRSYEVEKEIRKLRMKVLSGDGDLNSAQEMAKKLRQMGYEIELIHYAPRSNFLQNTVYSPPKFQNEAKHLVLSLGRNTIYKPLTWPSIFDLIVVTGKNP